MIEVTRDFGVSWVGYGLPSQLSVTTPIQCPVSPSTCVAGAYDFGADRPVLLRTADGGRIWSAQLIRNASYIIELACATDLSCTGIFTPPPHPFDGRWVVKHTADGGRSWVTGPPNPR